jgi:hypothetical protein
MNMLAKFAAAAAAEDRRARVVVRCVGDVIRSATGLLHPRLCLLQPLLRVFALSAQRTSRDRRRTHLMRPERRADIATAAVAETVMFNAKIPAVMRGQAKPRFQPLNRLPSHVRFLPRTNPARDGVVFSRGRFPRSFP